MPRVNVLKGDQRESIKLCEEIYEQGFLVQQVETSRERGGCHLRRGGRPGILMRHLGTHSPYPDFNHADAGNILFLCLPHSVMV